VNLFLLFINKGERERGIAESIPCSDAHSVDSACSNQSNYFCYYDCKIKTLSSIYENIKHNTGSSGMHELYMRHQKE
jgi:hypothetical protein